MATKLLQKINKAGKNVNYKFPDNKNSCIYTAFPHTEPFLFKALLKAESKIIIDIYFYVTEKKR